MVNFVILTFLYIQQILQVLAAMFFSFKTKIEEINFVYPMVNQTQDEAIDLNDNFWSISTLHDNKKVLHHLFTVQLFDKAWFPMWHNLPPQWL